MQHLVPKTAAALAFLTVTGCDHEAAQDSARLIPATGPRACVWPDGLHASAMTSPFEDLGDGVVAAHFSGVGQTAPYGVFRIWQVFDCRSGSRVNVRIREQDINHTARFNRFYSSVQEQDRITLGSVSSRAFSSGLKSEVSENEFNRESCGCAAFYPELRGEKRPYSDRNIPATIEAATNEVTQ